MKCYWQQFLLLKFIVANVVKAILGEENEINVIKLPERRENLDKEYYFYVWCLVCVFPNIFIFYLQGRGIVTYI